MLAAHTITKVPLGLLPEMLWVCHLATLLAARFAEATAGQVPISFSGGIDQKNCADVVACGLLPVTVCTADGPLT